MVSRGFLNFLFTTFLAIVLAYGIFKYVVSGRKDITGFTNTPSAAVKATNIWKNGDQKWRNNLMPYSVALSEAKYLESMISIYYGDHEGIFPQGSNTEIFRELIKSRMIDTGRYKFNSHREMIDPWGNPYIFVLQLKEGYGVYSFGPNCKNDNRSDDDIIVWTKWPPENED